MWKTILRYVILCYYLFVLKFIFPQGPGGVGFLTDLDTNFYSIAALDFMHFLSDNAGIERRTVA
jgi:hypothetical protein